MLFGHLPEIIIILALGLLFFGPKKMIEMGGQVGRSLRELQSAIKDMNLNSLGGDESTSASQSPLGKLSQLAQDMSERRAADAAEATPTPTPAPDREYLRVVETEPASQPTETPLAE